MFNNRLNYDELLSENERLKKLLSEKNIESSRAREDKSKIPNQDSNWFSGFFIATNEGIITYCNQRFADIFGFDQSTNMIGMRLNVFFPEMTTEILEKINSEHNIAYYNKLRTCKNGATISLMENYFGYFDQNKNLQTIYGTIVELPINRNNDIKEIQNDEKYHKILSLTPAIFTILDKTGKIIFYSGYENELLGYNKINRTGTNIFSENFIHPEDRSKVEDILEKLIKNPNQILIVEYRGITNIGYVWFEATAKNYLDNPSIEGILIIIQEISRRKNAENALQISEEIFKQMIKNSFDTFVLMDENGCQKYVSESVERITGFTRDEVTNIPVIEQLIHPEDREMVLKMFQQMLTVGYGIAQYRHKHKLGHWVFLEAIGNNQLSNPYINSIILNVRDITDRLAAENALKTSEKKLRDSNSTKDKFFSIIAHDLKAPFNSILGISDILIEDIRNYSIEETEQFIKLINNTANQTYNLLEDLLLWAKSQTEKLPFQTQKICLHELCIDVLKNISQFSNSKGITINSLIDHNIYLVADSNMLKTIFRNLITNAIKFSYKNGKILIDATCDPDFVTIQVKDNGIGIETELLDKIWEIDELNVKKGTAGEKGTGFGLSLCKEFVEKHGGKIWAVSKLGEGSDFYFTIPVHK